MGLICFFVVKAFFIGWSKSWKFVWKYKVRRKKYSEKTIDWVFSCIDAGIGWYDAKKLMMVKSTPTKMMNETLWIYDQILNELNKEKGGRKKHGKQYARGNRKKISEFPTISNPFPNSNSEGDERG